MFPRSARWLTIIVATCSLALVATYTYAVNRWTGGLLQSLPRENQLSLYALLWDQTPVPLNITVGWQKIRVTMPADRVRSDRVLWRQMFFDDWDRVPSGLREQSLDRMWTQYAWVVHDPSAWDRMAVYDWNQIPQPIRAMAFIEMVRYWSGAYQVGASYGLPRGTVTDTMAAIMITESWFEHQSSYTNSAGNRDIGLAQASDHTRQSLARLRARGAIDFAPERDEDYFDPWKATRVLAIWFQLMLNETGGDLEAAIRAYHKGAPLARAGDGAEYLKMVVDRRRRFMRDQGDSPTWRFLWARVAALRANDNRPESDVEAAVDPVRFSDDNP
jgi:hypothetical protein